MDTLVITINQSLMAGICSAKLKIAKVNPVFKKDDLTQFTYYRPILLLPVMSNL